MTARYWVLCADELMAQDDLRWPVSLRSVRPSEELPPPGGMRWWLFEDDDPAAQPYDGKRVELVLGHDYETGAAFVVDRRAAS